MSPDPAAHSGGSAVGRWAIRSRLAILFVVVAVCLGGVFCAFHMPSSVFPETEFPRAVILIDNGVMPADEMMATITRPVEEAMKDIPGVVQVRSATGRGAAQVNVFFNWRVDMVESELYVLNKVSQLKATLPASAKATVWRLTFNAFPIIGVSLTSPKRDTTELWELAQYDLKPRFLRIGGVARVDLVGGRAPEYHVVVDPIRLAAEKLSLADVTRALAENNLVAPAGVRSENYTFYLTLVDGRLRTQHDIEDFVVAAHDQRLIHIRDFARVERGPEPVFNVVNAQGRDAVLLNIRAQPRGSNILSISKAVDAQVAELKATLPPDVKLSYYYDQSLLVKQSVGSVWDAILTGLLFAAAVLYLFLRNWGSVATAIVVVPVSVLTTVVVMYGTGLTFNLMTLGGIAAAIGLIIDDAIVVVEAIASRLHTGQARLEAIQGGLGDVLQPLLGSTLTPVVVFIPLAFLDGVPGVFFRSLALTMVASLLTSLVLAISLTPSLASLFLRAPKPGSHADVADLPRPLLDAFGRVLRPTLRRPGIAAATCLAIGLGGLGLFTVLKSDFMPAMDEGGFIIDCLTPWGTSLQESDRMMRQAEAILQATPEVEGYSRRTGARLALAIAEPNKGDILVKLRPDRKRSTETVKRELRSKLNAALPGVEWEFPGILSDLLGNLTDAPNPIQIKLFSNDTGWLMRKARAVKTAISKVRGVVDLKDGLVMTGPSLTFRVRQDDAHRFGLTTDDIATALNTALLGRASTAVLEGDRVVAIRVQLEPQATAPAASLKALPLRTPSGQLVTVGQVADLVEEPGQLELRREDLRQMVAITGAFEGRDLGSGLAEIKKVLAADPELTPGTVEIGGLFQQQQESFRNLLIVLAVSIGLVLGVLVIEFRSFREPLAIVGGAVLALVGTALALWVTDTTLNIVSLLGAIIGVGIVAKNGILMLDQVDQHLERGEDLREALVLAGQRRLRPILMTTLATILAMLPLAWGIGHGADMLRPLAIGLIGALCVSILLSLVATPTFYLLLQTRRLSA